MSERQQKTEIKRGQVAKRAWFGVKTRTRCRQNVPDVDITMLKSLLGCLVKNRRGLGENVGVLGLRK